MYVKPRHEKITTPYASPKFMPSFLLYPEAPMNPELRECLVKAKMQETPQIVRRHRPDRVQMQSIK